MSNFFTIAGRSGLASLLSRFSANLTTDLMGTDTQLSQSLSGLMASGVGSLTNSVTNGQTSTRELVMGLSQAESRPIGRIVRNAEGRGTAGDRSTADSRSPTDNTNTPANTGRYYQTQSQMFAALIRALRQGERNC